MALLAVQSPECFGEQSAAREVTEQVVTPGDVMNRVRRAYRTGPVAERVSVRIAHPSSVDRRATVIVRVDAGEGKRPERIMLELGRLHAHISEGELTVVDARDIRRAFGRVADGLSALEVLRAELPPLPIPQLGWAFGADETDSHDTMVIAGAPAITWVSIGDSDQRDRGAVTLIGSSSAGEARLVVDRSTFRARRLSIPLAGKGRMELVVTRVEARDAASWSIPVNGRVFVASLEELVSDAGERAKSKQSERMPALELVGDDLGALSFTELFKFENQTLPLAAMILYRAKGNGEPDNPGTAADVRAACAVLQGVRVTFGRDAAASPKFTAWAVGLFGLTTINPEGLAAAAKDWEACARTAWCGSEWEVLAGMFEGNAVLLVVRPDRTLVGVIPLEGRAEEEDSILSDLTAMLKGEAGK